MQAKKRAWENIFKHIKISNKFFLKLNQELAACYRTSKQTDDAGTKKNS